MRVFPDRPALKAQAREQLKTAQVSPMKMTALYGALVLGLNTLDMLVTEPELLGMFVSVLTTLASGVLTAGFVLYIMDLRRGQRAGYGVLFDGFSFTGKIIMLHLVTFLFVFLWSLLLLLPGVVAAYRYRFAPFYLYEDPSIDIMEALRRSCRETEGWKMHLFNLDMSYLGWRLVQVLPAMAAAMAAAAVSGGAEGLPNAALSAAPAELYGLWVPVAILCQAWSVAVSLCFLPVYQWVELAYFDQARAGQEAAVC